MEQGFDFPLSATFGSFCILGNSLIHASSARIRGHDAFSCRLGNDDVLTTKTKRRRRDESLAHPEGEHMRAGKGGVDREMTEPRQGRHKGLRICRSADAARRPAAQGKLFLSGRCGKT
jgi:hypothetical protein